MKYFKSPLTIGLLLIAVGIGMAFQKPEISHGMTGGDGSSEGSAWIIGDCDDLQDVGSGGSYELGDYYKLSGSFSCSGIANFEPIGDISTPFTGTLDGDGYTISDLTTSKDEWYVGLFGYISTGAVIQDLTISDASITNGSNGRQTGVVVGEAAAGTITNVHVTNPTISCQYYSCGGIIGQNAQADIIDSSVTGLDMTAPSGGYFGGITGYTLNINAEISGTYATGSIDGGDWGGYIGGLVGYWGQGSITDSYARVSVSSTYGSSCGGLIGWLEYTSANVDNSYATGSVSCYSDNGGFLGYYSSGSCTNSFWDTETSGQSSSGGGCGTGKTTTQMKTESTFTDAGWDFPTTWDIDGTNNDGYAYLAWQDFTNPPTASNFTGPGTTDFESEEDLTAVSNMKLATNYGYIQWLNDVNAEGEDYDSYVRIGDGYVSLDDDNLDASIDTAATVAIKVDGCYSYTAYYSSSFVSSLAAVKAGQECNNLSSPACVNMSCVDNVLTFNVSHFDSYGGEGIPLGITTTAGVGNSAPVFTAVPSDGGSSSSAPTNAGSDVTFTATGTDSDSDQYYLAICKTDVVTVGDDAAPTCGGGDWDISAATNSGSAPTVSPAYTAQDGDSESNDWYAFVCDKKASVNSPACYPANGSGDQGSAYGTITFTGVPVDAATLTIDSVNYEFDTDNDGLTNGGYTEIDTSASSTAGDTAAALVSVETGASSSMVARLGVVYVYADSEGAGGNSIAMAEAGDTGAVITLSGASLSGGNDDNASPFKINHRPVIGTVNIGDTTGGTGDVNAGDDVYFNVAVTDGDTDGTADTVDMHVCLTNSFTEGVGCDSEQTICKTLANAPGTLECDSGDTTGDLTSTYNDTGTSAGEKTVYIFLEDSHDLQDAGTDNTQVYDVVNIAPSFTAGPTDSGSSATSPTEAGTNVTFTATATDSESDDYYLLVCNNNSAPTTGAPPECNGGSGNRWALSSATTSGDPVSSVTYSTSSSDSESNIWYAFVCDADNCSSAAQGSGDNGSPFVVNHAPTFNAVAISENTITPDELLTDGNMEAADASAWTANNNGTLSKETGSPHGGSRSLRIAYNDTTLPGAYQSILTIDHTYRLVGWARGDGTSVPRIWNNNVQWTGTSSTSWQAFDITFVAGQVQLHLQTNISSSGYVEFDDVSVFEIGTIEPGDTLRFTLLQEQMTETDTEGGQDTINMYVCSSSTTGYSSGCTDGTLICSDTAVDPSSEDATCDESGNNLVPIPTAHGTPNVKVYIEDSEGLAGTGTAQQDYTVEDVAPTITSYSMTDTLVPVAGAYDTYEYTAVISDNNGEADIEGAEGWFYDDTAIDLTAGQCTEDENDCYKDSDDCALNTSYGTDVEVEATCSMNIWFNANASTGWAAHVNVEDETTTVTDGSDSDAQENPELQGITVSNVSSIAYGTVALGEVSVRKETAMGNVGNQIIDVYLTGTDMTCSAGTCGSETIGKAQQKWYHSDVDFNWNDAATDPGPYTLVGSTGGTTGVGGCANRNIAVRDSHVSAAGDESVWWKLKVPETQASGEYTGTNTFTTTGGDTCTGTQY